jgi:hypothetical protein
MFLGCAAWVPVMRFLLPVLSLTSILAFTASARADTIDDLVVTGAGHTITFSLPSVLSLIAAPQGAAQPDHVESGSTGFVDGVGGYNLFAEFVVPNGLGFGDLLSVSPSISGGSSEDGETYFSLFGPLLVSPSSSTTISLPTIPYTETTDYFTLIPGTFTECEVGDPSASPSAPCAYGNPVTVTIMPETSPTPTPEPSSFILLATGGSGLLGTGRRRRSPVDEAAL